VVGLLLLSQLFLALASAQSWALTISQMPLVTAVQATDAIVLAKISSKETQFVDKSECGTKYTAKVSVAIKGSSKISEGNEISFGRYPGLLRGHEYVLLLNHVGSAEQVLADISNVVPRSETDQQAIELIQCNGIVPGYYFNLSKAWEVLEGRVVIKGKLPRGFSRSHAKRQLVGHSVVWAVSKAHFISYLRRLVTPR
jgi:hypothetical protein